MSDNYQSRSAVRKATYFGLILGLLTVTLFWRGKFSPPGALAAHTVQRQATALELREVEQGETELTGSAIRLLLTGSRGLAVTSLWIAAQEKQKKHEWNELELLVKSITKLQPHFITPWLFQSWNIAYNVSVESDRLNDMYFYIGRGIELLAEGERINKNNPDLRYWVGFTYQNKFGVSDKVDTLRCLYALSCMPPGDRDPKKYAGEGGRGVNLEAFRQLVERYPHLTRRLRESKVAAATPQDVLDFLRDNRKVASRYADNENLAAPAAQFPVLPTGEYRGRAEDQKPTEEIRDGQADAFLAARAWFAQAVDICPDPTGEPEVTPDRAPPGKKIPRKPALIIFRSSVPRAQSYAAERLQTEGWFDETGWAVDERQTGAGRWFPDSTVVAGAGVPWSKAQWEKAFEMWYRFGRENALILTPEQMENYRSAANLLAERGIASLDSNTPPPTAEQLADPALARGFDAHRKLMIYRQNLGLAKSGFFVNAAEAEKDDLTIRARKLGFDADRLWRRYADPGRAVAAYRESFALWKQAFEKYKEYHAPEGDTRTQEDVYERYVRFMELVNERYAPDGLEAKRYVRLAGIAAANARSPLTWALAPLVLEPVDQRLAERDALAFPGPLDGTTADGRPWFTPDVRSTVLQRLGLVKPPPAPEPGTAPAPATTPFPSENQPLQK